MRCGSPCLGAAYLGHRLVLGRGRDRSAMFGPTGARSRWGFCDARPVAVPQGVAGQLRADDGHLAISDLVLGDGEPVDCRRGRGGRGPRGRAAVPRRSSGLGAAAAPLGSVGMAIACLGRESGTRNVQGSRRPGRGAQGERVRSGRWVERHGAAGYGVQEAASDTRSQGARCRIHTRREPLEEEEPLDGPSARSGSGGGAPKRDHRREDGVRGYPQAHPGIDDPRPDGALHRRRREPARDDRGGRAIGERSTAAMRPAERRGVVSSRAVATFRGPLRLGCTP